VSPARKPWSCEKFDGRDALLRVCDGEPLRLKVAYSFLAALLPRSGVPFQQAGGLPAISQGWSVNAPPLVCIRRESRTPKGSQRPRHRSMTVQQRQRLAPLRGAWRLDIIDAQSGLSLDCAGRAERRRRFGSVPERRLWMRFPALPCNPERGRASLAAAVQKKLSTQGQASLAEHTDSTRSLCLTWPPWGRRRLACPGAAKGRCSGLRPRLRTGRPRSQRGFVTPRNVQSPGTPPGCLSPRNH